MKNKETKFEKEVDLCSAFITALPKEWTAYPETGGFDILLVRKKDGFQIGVEAKLKLNAKVVAQAAESNVSYRILDSGPDCRAVLIPAYVSSDLACLCDLLNITIIRVYKYSYNDKGYWFNPSLPSQSSYAEDGWHEFFPHERIEVPDWIPDVCAGCSSPVKLTPWKVGAIKLAIIIEKRGILTRRDFKDYGISMSRWTQCDWLKANGKGQWIKGQYFPDFKAQHPTNYSQIEADYEKWKQKTLEEAGRMVT